MDTSRSNWCLIFVMVIVMVASLGGIGSTQQTLTVTANTTTTTATATATGEQGTQVANGTTTSIETTALSSTTTPDANDGWESATPIGTDRTANGTLPVGDQDWYVFSAESSGRITVRLVAGNRTNMSGFLYNGAGDLLDSSYIAPGEEISLTGQATSAGDYYVFVRNEANTTGAYAFTVSLDESTAAASADQPQPTLNVDTSSENGPVSVCLPESERLPASAI